jgi:hypothetical protein
VTEIEPGVAVPMVKPLMVIPKGVGGGLTVRINVVGTEHTEALNAFQYMIPLVSRVSPVFSPTSGQTLVTTFGRHFGAIDYSDVVRIGLSNTNWMIYFSDTSLRTRSVPGVGNRLAVALSVQSQHSTFSSVFSYIRPQVSSLLITNFPATGCVSVTASGNYFGTHGSTPSASLLSTAGLTTFWVSDTLIGFKVPSGAGVGRTFVLSVGLQLGSLTRCISYDNPAISTLTIPFRATSASFSVTVMGASYTSFVGSSRARFGSFQMASSTGFSALQWLSDSSVITKIPHGSSLNLGLFVSIRLQQSSLSRSFSFDSLSVISAVQQNSPASGSSLLTVSGSRFSIDSSKSPGARISVTSSQLSSWVSDSSLLCKFPSGSLRDQSVTASILLSSSVGNTRVTFDVARMSSIRVSNFPLSGFVSMTVSGSGFSLTNSCSRLQIRLSVSSASVWNSDSSVLSKVASGSRSSLLAIISGNVRSSRFSQAPSYDTAIVSSVSGAGASTGSIIVHVFGNAYAAVDTSHSIRISTSACMHSNWIADSSVFCKLVAGVNRPGTVQFPVLATIGGMFGSASAMYSFLSPDITATALTNIASSGAQYVVLLGLHFGAFDYSASALVGRSAGSATFWNGDSSLKIKSSQSVNANNILSASVGVQGAVSALRFSANAPVTVLLTPGCLPSTACMSTTVLGRSFGANLHSLSAHAGHSVSVSSAWLPDSSLVCKVGSGVFSNLPLHVTSTKNDWFSDICHLLSISYFGIDTSRSDSCFWIHSCLHFWSKSWRFRQIRRF